MEEDFDHGAALVFGEEHVSTDVVCPVDVYVGQTGEGGDVEA